jgi:hypothetical protein
LELTTATKIRAGQAGWSDALLARLAESPVSDATVANLALMKVDEARVATFLEKVDANPDQMKHLAFSYARTKSERGVRARPGPNGLGTPEINVGTYGQVPDHWPYENDTPLGAHPDMSIYLPGSYHIYEKAEVWAEDVDQLYEEAIRNRWIPATDLPWNEGLGDLPEEIERSFCQLATVLSSHALTEQKIIARWLEPISYGFHDVKLFLGTQIYDAGHKVEALRKRALANGGGLGRAPMGLLYRSWYGSLKFTELMVNLDVVYKSFECSLFEAAGDFAKTDLDRKLFELLLRDSRRHLEYGKRHLLWYLQHHPNAAANTRLWLTRAESALAADFRTTTADTEALVVLFADGLERISAGMERLKSLRQKQLADYLALLDEVGIDRLPALNPALAAAAETPLG